MAGRSDSDLTWVDSRVPDQPPTLAAQSFFAFRSFAAKIGHFDMHSHARQQFARRKRLDEIVVGVGLETFHARRFARPRRQQDDWRAGESRVIANARNRPNPSRCGIITSASTRAGRSCLLLPTPGGRRRPRAPHIVRSAGGEVLAHVRIVIGDDDEFAFLRGLGLRRGASDGWFGRHRASAATPRIRPATNAAPLRHRPRPEFWRTRVLARPERAPPADAPCRSKSSR